MPFSLQLCMNNKRKKYNKSKHRAKISLVSYTASEILAFNKIHKDYTHKCNKLCQVIGSAWYYTSTYYKLTKRLSAHTEIQTHHIRDCTKFIWNVYKYYFFGKIIISMLFTYYFSVYIYKVLKEII